jgi:FtsH ternary system domain X1
MTAEDTALRIARWAASDMTAALPEGDLMDASRLADPSPELLWAIGRLASITAARLRLTGPLLGDERPPGLSGAVLAAAIGGHADGERAAMVLRAVPSPTRAADLLVHYELASAAIRLIPGYADQVRDLSPLTGVLDRPGPRTIARCEDLLERLRSDPAARSMVVLRFAMPPDTPEQATWRAECLSYIRHEDPGFVLDTYETAFVHYGLEHEIRARVAWRQLLVEGSRAAARYTPTALWWRALAELEVASPRRVRALRGLAGQRRRIGTNLYRRVQQLEAA